MDPDLDLEFDGEISGIFCTNDFVKVRCDIKNESSRKRELEKSCHSGYSLTCFDDGRHDSGGSSSSSSSSSSDGSTGLEQTISDIDISGSDDNLQEQSENCSKNVDLEHSFRHHNDRTSEETPHHWQHKIKEEAFETNPDPTLDGANKTLSPVSARDDNNVQEHEFSSVNREFDPLQDTTSAYNTFESVDGDGDTLLHMAIITLQLIHVIEYIISSMDKTSLNILNHMFQTPLHLAVLTGQSGAVRALLKAGACTHFRDRNGRTPLHIACEKRNIELLEVLINREQSCSYLDDKLAITYPTESCNMPLDQLMNLANSDGQSCVHIAATNNDIGIMKLLLANGADINYTDKKSGRTALHSASELGYLNMVKFLLGQDRLEMDRKTRGDETALAIAFHRKHIDICNVLKERGAMLNFKYLAKFGVGSSEIVKRLRIDYKN